MNKKIIIGLICFFTVVLVAILITLYFVKSNNVIGKNEKIEVNASDEILKNISFNGMKYGDKIEEKMKNLVLDAMSYKYEYKKIGIADKNDLISGLYYYSEILDLDKFIFTGIEDANIMYNNKKLTTVSEFKNILGEGKIKNKETSNNRDSYSIVYYGKTLNLELLIINNQVCNLYLTENM